MKGKAWVCIYVGMGGCLKHGLGFMFEDEVRINDMGNFNKFGPNPTIRAKFGVRG